MDTSRVLLRDVAETKHMEGQVNASLRELFHIMHKNGQGVVVVLRDRTPVGILTERDAVRLLYKGANLDESADRVARKPLVVANGKRTIGYALNLMLENNIRRMIVVDDAKNFIGVITQKELLRNLEDEFHSSSLKVKHVFDQLRELIGVSASTQVIDVLKVLVESNISAVPILDDNGFAIGIITEKDILKIADENMSLQVSVDNYMSRPVIFATLETKLSDIVKAMNSLDIRRVVLKNDDGRAIGMITNRDLIKNLEGDYNDFLERKLKYSKDVLNLLPEMLFELIDTDKEQLIVWANEKALSVFGGIILDKPVTKLVPLNRWKSFYAMLIGQNKIEDVRFRNKDHIFELSGFYLPLEKISEKGRIQLILRDISEEVAMATTDPLTNIYNRRYINEFLSRESERCKRTSRTFSVVILDVDDFKAINDAYGHLSGDIVLKNIVKIMIDSTREYDIVGRYGGEEFLIIMPEVSKEAAFGIAERIRHDIFQNSIELPKGDRVMVTASFGISSYREDGTSPEDLLIKADERLYQAKVQGKNMVISA